MEILKLIPDYIQAFAIVFGGGWAYWKFILQRQKEPATDIDIDLSFVGTQREKWIIEVTCFLENKSLVRHTYEEFQVNIRYLLPEDEVEDGPEKIQYQLNCLRTIDERIYDKNPKRTELKRLFSGVDITTKNEDENRNYINPKQKFRHRYITWIPINSTFVWIQCKFLFKLGSKKVQKTNSQKIFHVPGCDD